MVGFYIVNFFLLFLNKSQKDPSFGSYNLAHSNVRVFHSFKPKLQRHLWTPMSNDTSARETHGYLFPKN